MTNLTQVIQTKSTETNSDGSSLAQFFPSFLWIVRDFTLKLVDDKGQKITSSQYLENCLKSQEGFSESIASKNRIRDLIRSFFRDRDCLTMVRPAEDEEVLRDLSRQPLSALRPEFQKQITTFKSKVLAGTRPKQMMGRTLNGEMMVTLIRSYTGALNSGGVPVISSAWERVVATQCQEAKNAALAAYDGVMTLNLQQAAKKLHTSDLLPIPEAELGIAHQDAKAAAKSMFWSKITDRDDERAIEMATILKAELRDKLKKYQADNDTFSESSSNQYITSLFGSLSGKSSVGLFSSKALDSKLVSPETLEMKKVLSDIEVKLATALNTSKAQEKSSSPFYGSKLKTVANQGISSKLLDEIVSWGGSVAEAFRLSGDSLQHDMDLVTRDVDSLKSQIATKQSLVDTQMKSAKRALQSLQDLIANEDKRYQNDIKRKNTEISRYESMYADLMQMHKQALSVMQDREISLKKKLEDEKLILIEEEKRLTGNSFALKNEAVTVQTTRKEDAANLQQAMLEQEKRITDLEKQLSLMDSDWERALQELTVQNNLALNKEKAAQKRAIDAEKISLDNDEKEEILNREDNLKKLQNMITEKSVQLLNVKEGGAATRFTNPVFDGSQDNRAAAVDGAVPAFRGQTVQSPTAARPLGTDQWGNNGKPKSKGSKCNQS